MSTETIHPMVIKAAQAMFFCEYGVTAEYSPEWWKACSRRLIPKAQTALTECGALECLEALELLLNNVGKNSDYPGAQVARKASAKATAVEVYGSAPE